MMSDNNASQWDGVAPVIRQYRTAESTGKKLTVATRKSYPISLVSSLEWSGIALNVDQVIALDRRSTCQVSP